MKKQINEALTFSGKPEEFSNKIQACRKRIVFLYLINLIPQRTLVKLLRKRLYKQIPTGGNPFMQHLSYRFMDKKGLKKHQLKPLS